MKVVRSIASVSCSNQGGAAMKVVRSFAVVLGFLFVHAVAHAQSDGISAGGDPTPYLAPVAAPSLVPQQSGYGLMWGGKYTLAPGDSVWDIVVTAVNVNNTNLTYPAPATWAGGTWSAMTGALPDGTYAMYVKYYVQRPGGTVVLVQTLQSVAVNVP